MIYVFDIDGTICSAGDNNYAAATPYKDRIERVNKLYDEGHTIVFLTARGMGRSNNSIEYAYAAFETKTIQQLQEWGVKYHHLYLGKPSGDIYIDDKGISDEDFFTNKTC